jgi:hypothetical protein
MTICGFTLTIFPFSDMISGLSSSVSSSKLVPSSAFSFIPVPTFPISRSSPVSVSLQAITKVLSQLLQIGRAHV